MKILVYSDDLQLANELICGAKKLGEVEAAVIGPEKDAQTVAAMGANVVWIAQAENTVVSNYISAVIGYVSECRPDAVLVGATQEGRVLAGRVAASLDTSAIAGVKSLSCQDGVLTATHDIYGGAAVRTERAKGSTCVLIARSGFSDIEKYAAGTIKKLCCSCEKNPIVLVASRAKEEVSGNIKTAKRVIGVGRGFEDEGQIAAAQKLADTIGASLGYTRPVVDADPPLVKNQPYLGVSGVQIKPDLYIAVGISGQTQHIVGINESKVVVCINKDKNALMFRHSDYGIVGDLNEVLPALTSAAKAVL